MTDPNPFLNIFPYNLSEREIADAESGRDRELDYDPEDYDDYYPEEHDRIAGTGDYAPDDDPMDALNSADFEPPNPPF